MGRIPTPRQWRLARRKRNAGSGEGRPEGRALLARGLVTISVLGATALSFGLLGSSPAAPDTNGADTTATAGNSGNTGNTGDTTTTTSTTTTTTTTPTTAPSTPAPTAGPSTASNNDGTVTWAGNGTNPDGSCASFQDDLGPVPAGEQAWLFILTSPGTGPYTLTTAFSPAGGTSTSGTQKGNGSVHFIVLSPIGATLTSASAVTGTSNSVLTVSHCQQGSGVATTISTTVFDATTNAKWSGTETVGATAYDTSTVNVEEVSGPSALPEGTPPAIGGTVTYTFFTNGSCEGDGSQFTVNVVDGTPDHSPTSLPLAAGSYSYEATYNGDSTYDASTGDCEPFSVAQAPSTSATVLDDAATSQPWTGDETTGAQAFDTSTVSGGVVGFTPTGTETYTLFDNGTCTGPQVSGSNAHAIISTQTVDLNSDGTVPNSADTAPLTPGNYSFDASYSGDANYAASGPSPCEPFSVNDGSTTTATVLKDATTGQNWAGTETAGATAYDTSTVSGEAGGIVPTGTVTYSYFTNGTCNGTPVSTQDVTLNADGSVPNSATTAPLAAGSYSFDAVYNGDSNYVASAVSACEPFTVAAVTSPSTVTPTNTPTNTPTAAPATAGATAAPATKPSVIAFTGADLAGMWAGAIALLGLGGLLVLTARRRKGRPVE